LRGESQPTRLPLQKHIRVIRVICGLLLRSILISAIGVIRGPASWANAARGKWNQSDWVLIILSCGASSSSF